MLRTLRSPGAEASRSSAADAALPSESRASSLHRAGRRRVTFADQPDPAEPRRVTFAEQPVQYVYGWDAEQKARYTSAMLLRLLMYVMPCSISKRLYDHVGHPHTAYTTTCVCTY